MLVVAMIPIYAAQTFEVASVRPSAYQSADGESNGHESLDTSPDGLTMRSITLERAIEWAYQVQGFQINGNLGVDRFDITAKAAGPVPVATLRAMLESLLAERFQLALHRESKQMSTLVLVVGKGGPKVRASPVEERGVFQTSGATMTAEHATMAELTLRLSGPLRTPVVDKTGMTGHYDFKIDLMPYFAGGKAGQAPDMIDIAGSALREELGLNLESHKELIEVLVIDHVEKTPAAN